MVRKRELYFPCWELFKNLQNKTPCFIYNLPAIQNTIQTIQDAFANCPFIQYYPIKTNPCLDIVRFCFKRGLGIDACSMGDLKIVEYLGVPPQQVSFTGVGLNESEMRFLNQKKIIPNLNSIEEVIRWGRLFPGTEIGIRVSTLHLGKNMINGYALKMGILPNEWERLREVLATSNLKIKKIHRHESKGSILHKELLKSYTLTFQSVPSWVWKRVKTINFGGGWGIPYLRKGQINLKKLAVGIIEITNKLRQSTGQPELEIEIEPGEFLVGESGYILTEVLDVKSVLSGGEKIQVVVLNTPFPISSGFRDAKLLSPVKFDIEKKKGKKQKFLTHIYGRSNSSMDSINKGSYLPDIQLGQMAYVESMGAYVPVLMSHFNEQDLPAEYVWTGNIFKRSRRSIVFDDYYKNCYMREE